MHLKKVIVQKIVYVAWQLTFHIKRANFFYTKRALVDWFASGVKMICNALPSLHCFRFNL
jgi:hypothetical protein